MIRFLIKRLLISIPVLLIIALISFILMYTVPGGPFDKEKKLPPEIKANVEAKYHLDKPVWTQFAIYIYNLVLGDMGPSYKYLGRSVKDILKDTFPVSLQLGLLAFMIPLFIGIPLGIIAAVYRNTFIDKISMFTAVLGITIPHFVLGAILILVFGHTLKLLPPALWEGWSNMLLPAITLGIGPTAYIARLTRASILEVLHKDFVRTAFAKGLPYSKIILKHVLKNALTPIISVMGPILAGLVAGSFVVEYIFSIPGMGRYFITAVTDRDYPLIMATTMVYAVLIVIANIVVDVLYKVVDPRVRLE